VHETISISLSLTLLSSLPPSFALQEEGEEGLFTPFDPRLLQRSRPMMRKNDALLLPPPPPPSSSSSSSAGREGGKEEGREGGEAGTGGSSSGRMMTAL